MDHARDILDLISTRRAAGQPFALATVVRTVAATAAKAGAKAVILPDGTISEGWIGGGCARAAVLKAAREAIADGKPRLVSVQPPDALQDQGVAAGEERAGVRFVKNMCPSQGTMDIFVEPVLPRPQLLVCGASPVALAIADLGRRLDFTLTVCAPAADQASFAEADRRIEGYALPVEEAGERIRGHRNARPRRRGCTAGRAGNQRGACRLRRQPEEGRGVEGEARRMRRRARAARRPEGAGRSRSRRDYARRDRGFDSG